jgi:transcriptional regulator with XRE-family HTH domain
MIESLQTEETLINIDKFAKSIRKRRKLLGLSQKDLAGLCGLTTEGLSKIERGDSAPKMETAIRLVKLLGGTMQLQWRRK